VQHLLSPSRPDFAPRLVQRLAIGLARRIMRRDHVVLCGIRLPIRADYSPRMRRSLYMGAYERAEAKILTDLLEATDRVLEAGSAIGFLGCLAAKRVGVEQVWLVEANPNLLPGIEDTFRLNGLGAPQTIHAVVAAHAGQDAAFFLSEDFWSSSTLPRDSHYQKLRIPRRSLNGLIEQTGATVLVCDVEGAEFELFDGFLPGGLRAICLEVHPWLAQTGAVDRLLNRLAAHGFRADARRCVGNILLLRRDPAGTDPGRA